MNAEGNGEFKQRLDALLRQWGAEEAARTTPAANPPLGQGAPRGSGAGWRKWAALVAAVLLVGVLLWRIAPPYHPRPAEGLAAAEQRNRQLMEKLTALQAEHESALASLAEAREKLGAEQQRLKTTESEYQSARGEWQSQRDSLQGRLKETEQKASALAADMAETAKAVKDVQTALAGKDAEMERLHKELAALREKPPEAAPPAAPEEMRRLRKAYEDAITTAAAARDELAALKAQRLAMIELFRQACLSLASSMGEREPFAAESRSADLRVFQEFSRRGGLLQRCDGLRRQSGDQAARDLLDRLEVVLTRLELVDWRDRAAAQALAAIIDRDLPERIEQALVGQCEDRAMLEWLIQAMLIVRGIQHAG